MISGSDRVREALSLSLLVLIGVLTVSLWTLDISTMQSTFAALLGAELVSFAMMGYVYLKPNYDEVGRGWMLAGCFFLATLLMIAVWATG